MNHWKHYCNEITTPSWEAPSIDVVKNMLARQAITNSLTFRDDWKNGAGDPAKLISKLKRMGGKLLREWKPSMDVKRQSYVYSWDDAAAEISCSDDDSVAINWASNNASLAKKFRQLQELITIQAVSEGKVFVLVPSPMGGLQAESIGIAASSLNEENYNPETVEGYKRVVADLKSENPLGRLAIFDGPPGTGKTFLIRALLADLPDVKFLLLPSNMTDELAGPTLLSTLMCESRKVQPNVPTTNKVPVQSKRLSLSSIEELTKSLEDTYESISAMLDSDLKIEEKTVPIVLIIEDADRCLASRATDNISAISSILNLSDGIIGNLLDLRIIATTNEAINEIDSALMRSGRLSERIEVNYLPVEKAKALYTKLGGKTAQKWDKKFYPLADIYAMVKGLRQDSQQLNPHSEKRRVGFAK
jgi:hypothetical protein